MVSFFTKDMRELMRYPGGNGRTTYAVPPSVRMIHGSAFASAHYLERISLGDSVQLIGAWAFTECGELMSIDLPRSLHSIGRKAFNPTLTLQKNSKIFLA